MSINIYHFNTTNNEQPVQLITQLKGHTRGINDICWSPDSRHLASASDDTTIIIWAPDREDTNDQTRITKWRCALTLQGHSNYVFCVDWASTGGVLASGSFDESIRLWDVRGGGRCLRTIAAHADPITSVVFSPDSTVLASSSYDGLIRLWDGASGKCLKTMVGEENPPVSALKFSPNGKYLLAASLDNGIKLWELHSGQCTRQYRGHVNRRYCIAPSWLICKDDERKTNGDDANTITRTTTTTTKPTMDHGSQQHPSLEQVKIIMGSEDGKMAIWSLNSTNTTSRINSSSSTVIMTDQMNEAFPPSHVVMALSVKPDSFIVAIGCLNPPAIKIYSW